MNEKAKIIYIDKTLEELDEKLLEQYDVIFTKDGIYFKHGVTGNFVLFNK